MTLRKTTLTGLLLLLAGSAAVGILNPDKRTLLERDARLMELKEQMEEVRQSPLNPSELLPASDLEALQSFEAYLQSYSPPDRYAFEDMRQGLVQIARAEPIVEYLVQVVEERAFLSPDPASPPAAVPPVVETPLSRPAEPRRPAFVIVDDEGC